MANRTYADLANSFVGNGNWTHESDGLHTSSSEALRTAALFDIARSLRAIKEKLDCPNIPKALLAIVDLRRMAKKKLEPRKGAGR